MNWPSSALLGQSVLSGIFAGALYGLLGLGLSLSWGLLRQINLAHFALAFLSAYVCYQLSSVGGMDPLATLAIIVPAFFLIGVALQWVFARFDISPFNSLLVTFGLTVIVESVIQSIWTADFRKLESAYGSMKWQVGELYIPAPELLTLALALSLSYVLWAVLRYTDVGRALRASAEDAPIAAAFGVNQPLLALLLSGTCAALSSFASQKNRALRAARTKFRREQRSCTGEVSTQDATAILDGWQSGRMRTPGKRVGSKQPTRVRIPPHPLPLGEPGILMVARVQND